VVIGIFVTVSCARRWAMLLRASGNPFLISCTALPVLFTLLMIPTITTSAIPRALPTDAPGHRMGLEEAPILAASFTPNRLVEGVLRSETGGFVQQARLACRKLPAEA
jgi:hypothetical protein